jgi:hypothetical protein
VVLRTFLNGLAKPYELDLVDGVRAATADKNS